MSDTTTLPTVRITAATLSLDDSIVGDNTVMAVVDIVEERDEQRFGLGTVSMVYVTVRHPSGNETTFGVSTDAVLTVLAAEGVRA